MKNLKEFLSIFALVIVLSLLVSCNTDSSCESSSDSFPEDKLDYNIQFMFFDEVTPEDFVESIKDVLLPFEYNKTTFLTTKMNLVKLDTLAEPLTKEIEFGGNLTDKLGKTVKFKVGKHYTVVCKTLNETGREERFFEDVSEVYLPTFETYLSKTKSKFEIIIISDAVDLNKLRKVESLQKYKFIAADSIEVMQAFIAEKCKANKNDFLVLYYPLIANTDSAPLNANEESPLSEDKELAKKKAEVAEKAKEAKKKAEVAEKAKEAEKKAKEEKEDANEKTEGKNGKPDVTKTDDYQDCKAKLEKVKNCICQDPNSRSCKTYKTYEALFLKAGKDGVLQEEVKDTIMAFTCPMKQ